MDRKKISLVVAMVLSAYTLPASAALNIYSNSVEQAEIVKNQGNYDFSQTGLSSEEANVVKGFGKDMPLGLSLQIIIPTDWKINLNEAATPMLVNWMGKNTWPYVLEELAKDNKLSIDINWNTRVVNVFSKEAEEKMIASKKQEIKVAEAKREELRKEAEVAAKKAEEVRKEVVEEQKRAKVEQEKLKKAKAYARLEQSIIDDFKANNPGQDTTIAKLYKNANVLPLERTEKAYVEMTANKTLKEFDEAYYILKPETMLSANLAEWAKANGWSLVWDADSDFRITKEVELKGTMLTSIDKVVHLYKKSKKPLMVKFFTRNKVIKIEDFNYDN